MHYTEFRARIYIIIDRALEAAEDYTVDSVHEDADDAIDQLLVDLKKEMINELPQM
mgnify:CR=1 FL=1